MMVKTILFPCSWQRLLGNSRFSELDNEAIHVKIMGLPFISLRRCLNGNSLAYAMAGKKSSVYLVVVADLLSGLDLSGLLWDAATGFLRRWLHPVISSGLMTVQNLGRPPASGREQ